MVSDIGWFGELATKTELTFTQLPTGEQGDLAATIGYAQTESPADFDWSVDPSSYLTERTMEAVDIQNRVCNICFVRHDPAFPRLTCSIDPKGKCKYSCCIRSAMKWAAKKDTRFVCKSAGYGDLARAAWLHYQEALVDHLDGEDAADSDWEPST
jgi:hypothetical protein